MRVTIIVISVVAGLFEAAFGQEFYVDASRNAIVREEPDSGTEPLLRLERSDQLNAVGTATSFSPMTLNSICCSVWGCRSIR